MDFSGDIQMPRRLPPRKLNAQRVVREKDNGAFMRLCLLLFCGLGLASGFVYAGRQHFTALSYGYKTEQLRRERDRLAEEQRHYLLQREAATSPVHLEEAAKRLGMQSLQAAQIDPLRQPKNPETRTVLAPKTDSATARDGVARNKPAAPVQVNRARTKPI
jgi:uncharacterized protein HemX